MSDHPDRQPTRRSDAPRSEDTATADDDFYRGGGATARVETTRTTRRPRTAVETVGRLLTVLFGLGLLSAIVVTAVVGASAWMTLRGTGFSVARAVISGGGLVAGSVLAFYVGVTLRRRRDEIVVVAD